VERQPPGPDLWDDAEHAVRGHTELGQVTGDLELLTGLRTDLNDACR